MSEPLRHDLPGARCTVWPDGPSWNGGRTAAIGGFGCDSAEAGARLLGEVMEILRAQGCPAVLGPMDGDTWHSYRLVSEGDGRIPFFLEPLDDPVIWAAFHQAGFGEIAHYASAAAALDRVRGGMAVPRGVTLRPFSPPSAERDLRIIHDLSNKAFAGSPFFTPIGWKAFFALYAPLVDRILPDLVLLALQDDGTPAGFVFGLPDLAEGPLPETAILKTYASLRPGLGSALCDAFHANARKLGCRRAIHALMHADNRSLRHSVRLGGTVFRHYALLGRTIPA